MNAGLGALRPTSDSDILRTPPDSSDVFSKMSGSSMTPTDSKFIALSPSPMSPRARRCMTPQMYSTPISKNYKVWPFAVVTVCGVMAIFTYIFFQLPEYRVGLRHSLYRWTGAKVENSQWVGGNREVVDFLFFFVFIGLPTCIGGIAMALADALPPVPQGFYRMFVRFLKRRIMVLRINMSYAESVATLFFLGLNSIWFAAVWSRQLPLWQQNSEDGSSLGFSQSLLLFTYTLGFNAVLCFSLLIIPATRNCHWLIAAGVDYSNGIKYHRWMAVLTIVCACAHGFGYYRNWIAKGVFLENVFPCLNCDIGTEGKSRLENFAGQVAMWCCIIIGITSLGPIRRKHYEVFYYCHHLFLVVLVCMVLHFSYFVMWMYPGVCLYMMHRIVANSQSRTPCEIVDMEAIPGQIVRLIFRRSPGKAGYYHAGQFLYLRIPMLSSTQWHPFSISSSPVEFEDTFSVHVKCLGNWTKELYALAIQSREQHKVPLIYVDGFYGNMSDDFQHYPVLMLIGGGIGATPIISILGKILDCKRKQDPAMADTKVYFYWSSREIGLFHEFEPLLDSIKEFDPQGNVIRVALHYTGKDEEELGTVNSVQVPNGVTPKTIEDASDVPTRPFYQSSRSCMRQLVLFFVVFFTSFGALVLIRLNYPFLGNRRKHQAMWPLQRLFELLLLLVGAACGWFVAFSEPKPRAMCRMDKEHLMAGVESPYRITNSRVTGSGGMYAQFLDGGMQSEMSGGVIVGSQMHSTLVFKHKLIRSRLNVRQAMAQIVKEQSTNFQIQVTGIGTWVSGPVPLIHSVEVEAALFAGIFDVHYEEFQL